MCTRTSLFKHLSRVQDMTIEEKKKNLKLLQDLSKRDLEVVNKFKKLHSLKKYFLNKLINTEIRFWDYGYLLEIERTYLTQLRDYLKVEDLFVGVSRECERISTCISLLDIITNKKSPIRLKDKVSYEPIDSIVSKLRNTEYEQLRYINTRNAERFIKVEQFKSLKENQPILYNESVYMEKAWYLYNQMKFNWMRGWWS